MISLEPWHGPRLVQDRTPAFQPEWNNYSGCRLLIFSVFGTGNLPSLCTAPQQHCLIRVRVPKDLPSCDSTLRTSFTNRYSYCVYTAKHCPSNRSEGLPAILRGHLVVLSHCIFIVTSPQHGHTTSLVRTRLVIVVYGLLPVGSSAE